MEPLRKIARTALGYDSLAYRTASQLAADTSVIIKEGWPMYRCIRDLRKSRRAGTDCVNLHFKKLIYPIGVRPGTADASTLVDNVVREEYGQLPKGLAPEWMIDAGAYIGDTSAYFLSRYPQLRVVALEPSRMSFAAAQRNLNPYGSRVQLWATGLAGKDGRARFSGETTSGSIRNSGYEIELTTVPTILSTFAIQFLDILKIDIEGAEEQVFDDRAEEWIERVGLILMELHGKRIEKLVLEKLRSLGFGARQYRSVWYCQRA